jgi:hypothetical protein
MSAKPSDALAAAAEKAKTGDEAGKQAATTAAEKTGTALEDADKEIKTAAGVEPKTWSESAGALVEPGVGALSDITVKAATQVQDTLKDMSAKAGDTLEGSGASLKEDAKKDDATSK